MSIKKPPLGLLPKKIHDKQVKTDRFNEVCGAITRYYEAGLKINIEWIEEYNDLVEYVDKDNRWYLYSENKAEVNTHLAHSNEIENNGIPMLIDGNTVLLHCKLDASRFGLTNEEARDQDMFDEYAVVSKKSANAGILIYIKTDKGEWEVNTWSTRFLIRVLLENMGISIPNNTE